MFSFHPFFFDFVPFFLVWLGGSRSGSCDSDNGCRVANSI